jgi:Ca-activated chloride channel family protein
MPLFIRPIWLWCAIPLIIIIWVIYYRKTRSHNLNDICDKELLPRLMISLGNSSLVPLFLLAAAWGLSIFALAGPSWTKVMSPVFKSAATTVILLDLSEEMLVKDPNPDRLTRARYKINDLLNLSADRRYGLAVFSGEAFTVSPVTNDVMTIISFLGALDPSLLPIRYGW